MSILEKKQHLKHFLVLVSLVGVLIAPSFLFINTARGSNDESPASESMPSASTRLENVGSGSEGGYKKNDQTTVSEILGTAVKGFLSLLGIIFIILTITGGTKYMTASGNEERAKEGLSIIRHAIIGLIIVVGSYAIWTFILENLILGS